MPCKIPREAIANSSGAAGAKIKASIELVSATDCSLLQIWYLHCSSAFWLRAVAKRAPCWWPHMGEANRLPGPLYKIPLMVI